ncbi:MAG: histidinol-phosphate transaminase [Pseudomonadota bacterium]
MTAHQTIRPNPGILDIEAYVGGASTLAGANRTIKLSANENPLGPSPKAMAAYRDLADTLHRYPGTGLELREAIADVHGLDAAQIVCGAGSDEIIALLIKAYVGVGEEVLYPEHGFTMFRLSTMAVGGRPMTAPEANLTTDIDALIDRLGPKTKIVFVANPNNPTGTMIGGDGLRRLADALPAHTLLVLDGAYAEYLSPTESDGAIDIVRERDNVVMTRTFSKIHGLAALRLGWCYGPPHVIDVLNRIRGPFNVTLPAQAAGEAAIRDQGYVEHCRITNEVWRDWLTKEVRASGFDVTPSHANFILVRTGAETDAVDQALKARGLIARRVDEYGLHEHIRISIGDESACRDVAQVFRSLAG